MVWHDGYPLSQTLFTSLHLNSLLTHDGLPLERLTFRTRISANLPLVTQVLRAYCIGVVKCCDSTIKEIVSEHFYEEEDFVTANFTRNLCSDVASVDIMQLLNEASKIVSSSSKLPSAIKSALTARLEIRKTLLQAFEPSYPVVDHAKTHYFKQILDQIESLNQSHSFATPTKAPVFSERVQRHLASNTPPRPIKNTSWSEAVIKLRQLCTDVISAFELARLLPDPQPNALMVRCASHDVELPLIIF